MTDLNLMNLRLQIDNIDKILIKKLEERFALSQEIQKLKGAALKYVPSREKEILANCRGPVLDIYIKLLSHSRQIDANTAFYYFTENEKINSDKLLRNVQKFFGENFELKKIEPENMESFIDNKLNLLNYKSLTSGKTENKADINQCLLVFSDCGNLDALAAGENKIFYKLSEYQISGKTLFFVYSNIQANDKAVIIDLQY